MSAASDWDSIGQASAAQEPQPVAPQAGIKTAAPDWDAIPVSTGKTGSTASPPEQKESGYSLPDTTMGRAAAGALGEVKGAFDTLVEGPAQLLSHAAASAFPDNKYLQEQKDVAESGRKTRAENFKDVTKDTGTSAGIGDVTGGIVGAMALPQSKAAEGANLINRMIAAGKTGSVIGAANPVSDDQDFWTDKAKQIGTTAIAGLIGQPVGEAIGSVVGKMSDSAMNIGKRVMSWVTGKTVDNSVASAIQNSSPELKQAVQEVAKSGKDIDPSALGLQVEADALPIKVRLSAGQATQDPVSFSNELNTRSENRSMVDLLDDQNKALIQNLNHIRDTGAPDVAVTDYITAGENLINAGQNVIDKKAAETSALYQKLADANGGALPMDGKAFVEASEKELDASPKGYFLPKEVRSIMDWLKRDDLGDKNKMTFNNFETLRTILGNASRDAPDGNVKMAVGMVRDALENMPLTSETQGLKQLADAARKSSKEGFDMTTNKEAKGFIPALADIASGKAADTTFIQKHIIGASKKNLTNLVETLKDDPQALQTIKAGTVNFLKKSAGLVEDSGNFGQSGYNKQLQALGPKLDVIFSPDEAAVLRGVGNVSRYIGLAPKGAYVNTSNTDVANLARQGAAYVVDKATGTPIGSIVKNATEGGGKAQATKISDMVGPAAGVGKANAANEFFKRTLPNAAGKGAAVTAASLLAGTRK